MSFGQGGPQWDPWKPNTPQQPWDDQADRAPQQPWGGQVGGQAPDWAALAEASETRNRRRRLLLIVAAAAATVGVGAAVAMGVVNADSKNNEASNRPTSGLPATADIPSDSSSAAPSFEPTSAPPPLDPKDFISSAKKDTAPLAPDDLFPGTQLTMGERLYKKGPTADTTNCASAAKNTLTKILEDNRCTRFLRVTYSKDGTAVTVGVAVFDTEAQATKVKATVDKKSIIESLSGGGVPTFCRAAICRSTTNSYGRYAYFTIAGFTNGKDVTEKSTQVFTTGDDLAEFAFRQIRRRGETQASAASQ
ncbi:membrane protein [Streptomyces sp. NRRL WC-3618]|uniref:hypothetical protein n=1 Tax=Streptomyces sp. NRRL WC-3618 TaxID=1519490 RepID=UPI0006AE526C|nr:hypothetical protein [Streptomyces sp. NRRL WC-3618]KOV82656.1 membrane protein [Streptomyces sp. NRRL WC-3618]